MTTSSLLLGFMAESAIHAGASGANHVIDLPIMREHNTGWPVVFGSAVKGALRAKAENSGLERQTINTLFGPDTENASDHAGSLLIGDARLLLLPVRSLTSQFRYVTSPNLIARWLRDQERAGFAVSGIEVPKVKGTEAQITQGDYKQLFLEEYVYQCEVLQADALVAAIASFAGRSNEEVAEKLTIVSDDQFTLLCRAAIPVNAHIAIDNKTKTVKRGALWYAESLPAETLLYSIVGAQQSRNHKQKLTANEVLSEFKGQLFAQPYLQLGGNETTGMGWCKVQLIGDAQ